MIDNTNYRTPITYRMLHEHAAGMGLEDSFFELSGIDPDTAVKCNCEFDNGHEPSCHIVTAHELIISTPTTTEKDAIAKEALEFYANGEHFHKKCSEYGGKVVDDVGQTAKEAISKAFKKL